MTCCASSPPDIEPPLPAPLIRPPCLPPTELLTVPTALDPLPGALTEQQVIQQWIGDMAAFQDQRGRLSRLQVFVRSQCQ